MANSDKNILITPNKNASGIPEIALTGFVVLAILQFQQIFQILTLVL